VSLRQDTKLERPLVARLAHDYRSGPPAGLVWVLVLLPLPRLGDWAAGVARTALGGSSATRPATLLVPLALALLTLVWTICWGSYGFHRARAELRWLRLAGSGDGETVALQLLPIAVLLVIWMLGLSLVLAAIASLAAAVPAWLITRRPVAAPPVASEARR
jgi:hypothetical protein